MTAMTVDIPDELAQQLQPLSNHMPRILKLGLREFQATAKPGFPGAAEIFEFLVSLPTPQEIMGLKLSDDMEERVEMLIEKSHDSGLTPDEEAEWQQYEYLEHLVRIAKAKARIKMKTQ